MRHMSLLFVFLLAPLAPLHSVQEPPDAARIAELRSDAEQSNAEAQYGLGNLYAEGQGVAQDYAMAYAWYNLAAAQGNSEARDNRAEVTAKLDTASLAEAQKLSDEYFKRYVKPFQ